MKEHDLSTRTDDSVLSSVVDQAIAANPKAVEDIRNGKGKAVGAIVMKEMKGKCDPATANQMIQNKLKESGIM